MIYFDNNATTRPLPEVAEHVARATAEDYANPSSAHPLGQAVRHRVETARADLAGAIGADPRSIVFTSGGTESIALAIRGALRADPQRRHWITSTVEHSAAQSLVPLMRDEGYPCDEIGVDEHGRVRLEELQSAVGPDAGLISVIWANNETGVIQDVAAITRIAAEAGVPVHLDAVQAMGKVRIDVRDLPVDLLSLSGHKFHGPKGIGCLYVRPGTRLAPVGTGGHQEYGLRPGTENVAGILGMAEAARRMPAEFHASAEADAKGDAMTDAVRSHRDRLEAGIRERFADAVVHGAGAPRVSNTTSVAFPEVPAEKLLMVLGEKGIYASAGAACSSGSMEPSHVLLAMGVSKEMARCSVRFSLSRFNTAEEIEQVLAVLEREIPRLNKTP